MKYIKTYEAMSSLSELKENLDDILEIELEDITEFTIVKYDINVIGGGGHTYPRPTDIPHIHEPNTYDAFISITEDFKHNLPDVTNEPYPIAATKDHVVNVNKIMFKKFGLKYNFKVERVCVDYNTQFENIFNVYINVNIKDTSITNESFIGGHDIETSKIGQDLKDIVEVELDDSGEFSIDDYSIRFTNVDLSSASLRMTEDFSNNEEYIKYYNNWTAKKGRELFISGINEKLFEKFGLKYGFIVTEVDSHSHIINHKFNVFVMIKII